MCVCARSEDGGGGGRASRLLAFLFFVRDELGLRGSRCRSRHNEQQRCRHTRRSGRGRWTESLVIEPVSFFQISPLFSVGQQLPLRRCFSRTPLWWAGGLAGKVLRHVTVVPIPYVLSQGSSVFPPASFAQHCCRAVTGVDPFLPGPCPSSRLSLFRGRSCILSEVSTRSRSKLPSGKNVVLLGEWSLSSISCLLCSWIIPSWLFLIHRGWTASRFLQNAACVEERGGCGQ